MDHPLFLQILRTKMQLLKGDAVTELAESTWRRLGVFAQNLSTTNEKNAAVQVGTERRPWFL